MEGRGAKDDLQGGFNVVTFRASPIGFKTTLLLVQPGSDRSVTTSPQALKPWLVNFSAIILDNTASLLSLFPSHYFSPTHLGFPLHSDSHHSQLWHFETVCT